MLAKNERLNMNLDKLSVEVEGLKKLLKDESSATVQEKNITDWNNHEDCDGYHGYFLYKNVIKGIHGLLSSACKQTLVTSCKSLMEIL